jgi:Tfp pilus assembly protein PilO
VRQSPVNREQIRLRLERVHKWRQRGMFGITEIVGLVCSGLMLFAIVFSYVYFLLPARARLDSLQFERSQLQSQLRSAQEDVNLNLSAKTTVQKITDSLDDFENNRLIERSRGRMILYNELNQLLRKNGLRNTSGPTYTSLEPLGTRTQQGIANSSKSANTKWQSIYPGIFVSVTVEGQYQNLRHFVRDIETSKQFLIVNAVELEKATESSTQLPPDATASRTGSGGSLVSLRLDMTTYFQRQTGEANSETAPAAH